MIKVAPVLEIKDIGIAALQELQEEFGRYGDQAL